MEIFPFWNGSEGKEAMHNHQDRARMWLNKQVHGVALNPDSRPLNTESWSILQIFSRDCLVDKVL